MYRQICYNMPIMSAKSLIWIGVFVGTTAGGALPILWGGSTFSYSSIIFSTIGGLLGIWGGFRLSQFI